MAPKDFQSAISRCLSRMREEQGLAGMHQMERLPRHVLERQALMGWFEVSCTEFHDFVRFPNREVQTRSVAV